MEVKKVSKCGEQYIPMIRLSLRGCGPRREKIKTNLSRMFNGCGMTYYGLGLIRMARPVLQLDRADLIGDTLDKSRSLSETVYSAASHLP